MSSTDARWIESATTADVCDAIGLRQQVGVIDHLTSLTARAARIVGRAVVGIVHDAADLGEDRIVGLAEILGTLQAGDVLVLGNATKARVAVFGGNAAAIALSHGAAGAVIDGLVRDLDELDAAAFPVWACGSTPLSGKARIVIRSDAGSAVIGTAVVRNGDLVVADRDGICVIG